MNIILEGPNGRRLIPEGIKYRLGPGERIVGSEYSFEQAEEARKLKVMAEQQGVGVGDLVAKLTKVFGISPCSKCQERQKVLNRLRIDGWKITLDEVE